MGACSLLLVSFVVLLAVSGCSTNPVTGESELRLVSAEQEIGVGRQSFAPMRQAQGGDYVADPAVAPTTCAASASGWRR